MKPEISVIIATHNRKHLVVEAVKSVFTQEPQNYEVIVVDDGSTDGTSQTLKSLDLPLKIIEQENNGVASARNTGIRHSQGEFIAFLDSDDIWLPTKLAKQQEYLSSHPYIPLVYTDEYIESEGERFEETRFVLHPPEKKFVLPYILIISAIQASSVMVRKKVFSGVGLFNEALTVLEDVDLWDRICQTSEVGYLSEPLVVMRNDSRRAHLSNLKSPVSLESARLYLDLYAERRVGRVLSVPEQYALEDSYELLKKVDPIR